MPNQQLHSSRFSRLLTYGLAVFAAPLLLVACNGNDIDIDELNAQALLRQKQVQKADSLAITKYIADSSFTNVQRQPSGLYIVTKKAGTGALPQVGQQASVIYKGTFLNNRIFDQSRPGADGKIEPFTFLLGRGQVIAGWDEGIGLMRKGQKAILLIPSALAYGPSGAQNTIPPDTPLRFDVELIDVK
ncbi:FKBP-type peptidyl-prolyl cis-trans isomerase [Hymenobacter sp. YC55]|uniref:FKBP-type peptidyl-prolyl cis-trans isomerase n=1 Tax=Hymenobacter sp. YC55 TaxID=3034019 RepID=UPI0023F66EAC|nr:FKBP-type peptidyl-prolyl cis-trans isomerase [Hymenobacter sp. YC55]MDF7814682.1 FKBP-type peptidyl-prolyl cis-trans isomerase [Hymenobacter sp. YC55]